MTIREHQFMRALLRARNDPFEYPGVAPSTFLAHPISGSDAETLNSLQAQEMLYYHRYSEVIDGQYADGYRIVFRGRGLRAADMECIGDVSA